ncbi:hypothetical protein BGX33_008726, partial [Mortierella sp. NVP41]
MWPPVSAPSASSLVLPLLQILNPLTVQARSRRDPCSCRRSRQAVIVAAHWRRDRKLVLTPDRWRRGYQVIAAVIHESSLSGLSKHDQTAVGDKGLAIEMDDKRLYYCALLKCKSLFSTKEETEALMSGCRYKGGNILCPRDGCGAWFQRIYLSKHLATEHFESNCSTAKSGIKIALLPLQHRTYA